MTAAAARVSLTSWVAFGSAFFSAVALPTARAAEPSHSDGIEFRIADQPVKLDPPLLTGNESAAEQEQLITANLRGLSFSQFARDSIVAPVRIDLNYIEDADGNRVGHKVHALFIVHASFSEFASDDFAQQTLGTKQEPSQSKSFQSEALTDEALSDLGINTLSTGIQYQRLTFDLLDKVRLAGVVRFHSTKTERQNRVDVSLVSAAENRWWRLQQPDEGGEYAGFRAWLTATRLASRDAVLIETRLAFHEPPPWFRGSNYLRSRLPLVLQEAARNLRRRLNRD